MIDRPFDREAEGAPREATPDDCQGPNVDQCLVLPVQRVEVRRCMLAPDIWMTMPKNWLIVGINNRLS